MKSCWARRAKGCGKDSVGASGERERQSLVSSLTPVDEAAKTG